MHMESRKMVLMNRVENGLVKKKKKERKRTCAHSGEGGVGQTEKVALT